MKNETLRKKLETKRDAFINKIAPLQEELDLALAMLAQLEAHEKKSALSAQHKLGIEELSL